MNIDHEQLEDWLADNGYVKYDTRHAALEQTVSHQADLINRLIRQQAEQFTAIMYILQGRVNGYKIKGKNIELIVEPDPADTDTKLKAVK